MDVVKRLIQTTTRAFYDDVEIIIIDLLTSNDSIRDDQLAAALNMNVRDLQKICGKLKMAGLLQTESRWEELNVFLF